MSLDASQTPAHMNANEESSGIQVGEQGDDVFVRVEGRGTHLNSYLLKQYLGKCLDEKKKNFQIDLSQCVYMDSTFLGMLAGVGGRVLGRSLPPIKLLNATDRVEGMLENLGVIHLFSMAHEKNGLPPVTTLPSQAISSESKAQEMLEAHQKLASFSPQNEARFRDVLEILKERTAKSK